MNKKVVIIDYGVGNVHSVFNAINLLGYKVIISSKPEVIEDASAIILPGVGAFQVAIESLHKNNLHNILTEQVLVKKKPILGICLGMQLFADQSYENGIHKGLGWIPGDVKHLELPKGFQVPHVGWNNTTVTKSVLFNRLDNNPNFYFDHSYYLDCHPDFVAATCSYGKQIVAAVNYDNIYGVQFHPEKSQTSGLKLFRGFLNSI